MQKTFYKKTYKGINIIAETQAPVHDFLKIIKYIELFDSFSFEKLKHVKLLFLTKKKIYCPWAYPKISTVIFPLRRDVERYSNHSNYINITASLLVHEAQHFVQYKNNIKLFNDPYRSEKDAMDAQYNFLEKVESDVMVTNFKNSYKDMFLDMKKSKEKADEVVANKEEKDIEMLIDQLLGRNKYIKPKFIKIQ